MRPRTNNQSEFNFQPSNLQLTNDYYAKYEAISVVLDEHLEIVDAIHGGTLCASPPPPGHPGNSN